MAKLTKFTNFHLISGQLYIVFSLMVFLKVDSGHNIATGLSPPKKIKYTWGKGEGRKGKERKGGREKQHIAHDI